MKYIKIENCSHCSGMGISINGVVYSVSNAEKIEKALTRAINKAEKINQKLAKNNN